MRIRKFVSARTFLILTVLGIFIVAGYAAGEAAGGDAKSGFNLTYRLEKGKVLKYAVKTRENQTMEMMGQTMEQSSDFDCNFSVKSKEMKDKNLLLTITLNSIAQKMESAMGENSPDMKDIIGKSFDLKLSPVGRELEFTGADILEYDLGQEGERNMESVFRTIFPDTAKKAVKVGDTWDTKDEFTEKTGAITISILIENQNTLKGTETIDGLECVKIETKISGNFDGEGEQMGNAFTLQGTIKGTSVWYFAYKKGILVKLETDYTNTGAIEVAAQGMSIPMTSKTTEEFKLVK